MIQILCSFLETKVYMCLSNPFPEQVGHFFSRTFLFSCNCSFLSLFIICFRYFITQENNYLHFTVIQQYNWTFPVQSSARSGVIQTQDMSMGKIKLLPHSLGPPQASSSLMVVMVQDTMKVLGNYEQKFVSGKESEMYTLSKR